MFKYKTFLILSILAFAFPAMAYYNLGSPVGFANDYANILSAEQKQALENKLSQFEKESSNEISVVIISSLQGDTIENFAVKLFEEWGIGKNKKDNGALILVAIDDRKMRIEVGYGLEGTLTDAQSSWIINDIMKPAFRENNYYKGLDGAVDKIILILNGDGATSNSNNTSSKDIGAWSMLIYLPFFLLVSLGFHFAGDKKRWPITIIIGIILFLGIYYLSKIFFLEIEDMAIWLIVFFVTTVSIILGRNKSWWEGGVLGMIAGISMAYYWNVWANIWWYAGILGIGGFIFDLLVSRVVKRGKGRYWWHGGSGGSSGGGFGGFGGGGSGGGGSSGSW